MTSSKANTFISLLLLVVFLLISDEVASQRRRKEIEPRDSLSVSMVNDSIRQDSLAQTSALEKKKKQPLNAPVIYEANDSIVFTGDGYAHLYGSGKVNYEKIELTSQIISMNMDSSTVYARGVEDTLGVMTGSPVFKDGDTPYETKNIRYNFKSKRGIISNVVTQQGEGYVVGYNTKKGANDELFMVNGRYTTCDHHDHPHFYLQLTRAKVRPKKNVVTGPAYLVVEDVPLPLFVPFFFFPFSSSYQSGLIMPTYMDDNNKGFGLTGGGYYFAVSDQMDAKVLGEIFTKGSWALGVETNYNKRYKYSGALQTNYQVTKTGDKNMPDYLVAKDFKIAWNHRQDAKASPNSTFSASVNFTTSSYERQNVNNYYNPSLMSQNTKTSSVSYSRNFPDQKLTISATTNIAQTMRDSSIAVTLPDLNISLSRVFPFKRKRAVGEERWYEKISLSYTGRLTNSIKTKDDELFDKNLVKDWTNGMNHTIPVSATFALFNYFNLTPSLNYTERWYTRKVMQAYNPESRAMTPSDTIYGFHRVYNYNASLGISTKLYGMYKPLFAKSKEIQIRHVLSPQVSISAAPDFGSPRYGYYEPYSYTDSNGQVQTGYYSPYSYTGAPFSPPGRGKQGNLSFDLSNNIEAKYKSDKDSTGYAKKSIIDELGASISYNLAADSMQWSDLSVRMRIKITKNYTLNFNSSFATYAYKLDKDGRVSTGKRTEWSYGRFGRFQGWGSSFNYSFNNDTWKKWFGPKDPEGGNDSPEGTPSPDKEKDSEMNTDETSEKRVEKAKADADGYQEFKMPWTFNVNYSFNISEDKTKPIKEKTMRYPYKYTHNLNASGNVKLSNNWAVNFNSGYDFDAKEITQTTFSISRDLHCFTMTASLSPFGRWKSYNFTIRATASILQDLKWEQRSQMNSNIQWY
ncbi:MAG: LPS-assembly protein LptD [Mediterranea sp.]|nr:LPS-assembly protein LptD [Mediterranea sp.]